jgi:hypothetical protein
LQTLLQTPDAANKGLELRIFPKEPITSVSAIPVRKRVIPASLAKFIFQTGLS